MINWTALNPAVIWWPNLAEMKSMILILMKLINIGVKIPSKIICEASFCLKRRIDPIQKDNNPDK